MKEFNLSGVVTVSINTKVEANSLEEAIEIANNRSIEWDQWNDEHLVKECWVCSDFDGEPMEINEI